VLNNIVGEMKLGGISGWKTVSEFKMENKWRNTQENEPKIKQE